MYILNKIGLKHVLKLNAEEMSWDPHCSFDIKSLDRLLDMLVCGKKVYIIVQEDSPEPYSDDITNVYHVDLEKRSCQKQDVILPNRYIFSSVIPAYFLL